MDHGVFTIGITGGSGSGKTYFISELSRRFSTEELCLLSQDHYYKPIELQLRDEKGVENFDVPESIDHEHFLQDILTLKKRKPVFKKEYVFNNPTVKPNVLEIKPAPILIVEGLFVQYFPEIEKELDLRIFIEAKDHLKLTRRIRRDNEERGYDLNDVLYRYQYHVMPIYERLIEPLKHNADFIIPNNRHFQVALELLSLSLKAKLGSM